MPKAALDRVRTLPAGFAAAGIAALSGSLTTDGPLAYFLGIVCMVALYVAFVLRDESMLSRSQSQNEPRTGPRHTRRVWALSFRARRAPVPSPNAAGKPSARPFRATSESAHRVRTSALGWRRTK